MIVNEQLNTVDNIKKKKTMKDVVSLPDMFGPSELFAAFIVSTENPESRQASC